jgi:hypothetical protein
MATKQAASFNMAKHLKDRSGRRPIRAHNLLRKEKETADLVASFREKGASESGADLRTPFMGGTKFPTKDSLVYAEKLLHEGQRQSTGSRAGSVTLKDVTPTIRAPRSMPKIGADMRTQNDPLVQYMKKTAETLEDNLDNLPTGPDVPAYTREEVTPDIKPSEEQLKALMSRIFDETDHLRKKDTGYDYDEGVVDRILGTL